MMKRIEIQASIEEINNLINLLSSDSKLESIRQQLILFKAENEHNQSDEIPAEGDDEYIERSE